ncbi:MAG: transcription termination factor Rho [Streptosporangiales bacterium]
MLLSELQQLASSMGVTGTGRMRKSELIAAIKERQGDTQGAGKAQRNGASASGSKSRGLRSDRQPTLDASEGGDAGTRAKSDGHAAAGEKSGEGDRSADAQRGNQSARQSQPRSARGRDDDRGSNAQNSGQDDKQDSKQDGKQDGGRNEDRQDNRQDNRDRQDNRQQGNRQQGNRQRDDDQGGGGGGSSRRRRGRRFRDRKPNRYEGGGGGEPEVAEDDVLIPVSGILDVLDNYAFIRTSGYLPGADDVYVSLAQVRRYGLRKGDVVAGAVRQPREGERQQKYNPLVRTDTINGMQPEQARGRVEFNKLTPLYPQDRLRLETESNKMTGRIIDLVAPIGKGQRGLIVSPSKAGKTMVLQAIANAITTNNPECHLMVVLVDERPEEVTDMQRSVKGEVIASTFDRPADDHTTVAELSIERAKRLAELGYDVVVMLDSMTRLGRAYNLAAPASGRIMSGGVDSTALYPPKRFFGAARNIENGGSLTVIATALVETGSRMDEVIFEEFKGTGNMELKLDRKIADKRVFPAIDLDASSTRKEELLLDPDELKIVWKLRRAIASLEMQQGLELIMTQLRKTSSNAEFLLQVQKTTPLAPDQKDDRGSR